MSEPLFPGGTSVFRGPHHSNAVKPTSLLHDRRFVDKIEIYKSEIQTGSNHGEMAVSMNDRGTISDPISLPHFWLRQLRQNSFSQKFCGIFYIK